MVETSYTLVTRIDMYIIGVAIIIYKEKAKTLLELEPISERLVHVTAKIQIIVRFLSYNVTHQLMMLKIYAMR